jgi:hypothetical protein
MKYIIEEQKTGLVDGYYHYKPSAISALYFFKREFPELSFVLSETNQTRELHDCEMINCSNWWINRNNDKK